MTLPDSNPIDRQDAEAIREALALAAADLPCSNGCGCEDYDYCAQDEARKALPALDRLVARLEAAEQALSDVDALLADPDGAPVDSINLARGVIRALVAAAGETGQTP